MTTEQVWTGAAAVLGLLVLAVLATLTLALLALRRARRAESLLAALAVRVGALESPVAAASRPVVDEEPVGTYVITGMQSAAQEPATLPVAQPIDGRLFADIVARESVVKAASWTHGLRRALSAESRNRIRFEVRRETRRATRERRAETKQALREFRARERALRVEPAGEDVA